MTQEEKQLLLVDLCARLPYLVRCTYPNDIGLHIPITEINIHDGGLVGVHGRVYNLYDIKPYLRPMSTMSSKERRELRRWGSLCMTENDVVEDIGVYGAIHSIPAIDWLNSHHFDYRGLIEEGLALEAPEDMYKTE